MRITLLLVLIMSAFSFSCSAVGPEQQDLQQRIESSPQWNGEKFENIEPVPEPGFKDTLSMTWDFLMNRPKGGSTETPLPARKLDYPEWPKELNLQFAWLGHTTYLFEMEGKLILTDPMFSQKAGAFGFLSPTRYSDLPLSVEELPHIDVVLITHNHYDHLDEPSIKALKEKTDHFIVPLAVGQYLKDWGVAEEKITELDWWEFKKLKGITITSAPARHFSGRGLFDRNSTLWASYGIRGENNNLYLSGDSGWHKELEEIRERLGPFDLTFIELGAYGNPPGWKEIHYTPEEAVKAHQAVGGKFMIPSHWGTFDLAMFQWHEPIERFITAAKNSGINYLTPKLGERINPGHHGGKELWWRQYIEQAK